MNYFINAKELLTVKFKNQIILLAKIIITLGVIFYLIDSIKSSNLSHYIYSVNIYYLCISLILVPVNFWVQHIKWFSILTHSDPSITRGRAFSSMMAGFAAGVFTPMRIGEYFGRKITLDMPFNSIIILTLADKFFLFITITFIGSIASVFLLHFYFEINYLITISLFLLLFGIFYLIFHLMFSKSLFGYLKDNLDKLQTRFKYFGFIIKGASNFSANLNIKLLSLSFLHFIVILLQFSFLIMAYEPHTNLILNFYSTILIMFSKTMIPAVTISDLGIRELASIYFLGLYNIETPIAIISSFSLYLINVLIPSIFGVYFLFRKQRV